MSTEYDKSTAETAPTLTWRPEAGILPEPTRPDYYPWEPTPGKIYNLEIADHQLSVREQASMMLEEGLRPPHVDEKLAEFVELMYWSREANRSAENTDSYNQSLHDNAGNDPDLREKLQKAELGKASPQEILELIDKLGMGSAELARLTHIYGYRIEHIEAMRSHVNEGIVARGGEVFESPEAVFNIVALDVAVTARGQLSFGIAMKRKRTIGRVDSTDVFERTTFIVRLDEKSHINRVVAKYLKSIPTNDPLGAARQMLVNGLLEKEVLRLLKADDFESLIPMSTTIYACNEKNRLNIEAELKKEQAATTVEILKMNPECSADLIRRGHFGATALNTTGIAGNFEE